MELVRTLKAPWRYLAAAAIVVLALFAFARIPVATQTGQQPLTLEPPAPPSGQAVSESAPDTVVAERTKAFVPNAAAAVAGTVSTPKDAATPQLARSGSIELLAPDVERALRDVVRTVRSNGATVTGMSDERPANEGDVHHASLTVSVPAADFDRMLGALTSVGRMRSRSISAEDVSDKLVDDGARLRNLRRTELDLLKIMDRSGRVSEVLDVERELSSVRDQIERLDAELASTQHRVARAQIDVSVVEDSPVRIVEPELRAQIAGAWRAALDQVKAFSLATLARTFVLVAFAPYLIALLVAGLIVRAMLRSRSRKVAGAAP